MPGSVGVLKQKITTVGSDRELLANLEAVIDERAAALVRVPSAEAALSMHESLGVDLILVVLPLEDMRYADFVARLRKQELSDPLRLVVVARGGRFERLSQEESANVVVLDAEWPIAELRAQFAKFLRSSPRTAERIMARLEVKMGAEKALRVVQMRDISATGMRVSTRGLLPVGTWITLEFNLPGDPEAICAQAEVVRHCSQETESMQGMGIRFTAFEEDGGSRLQEHIRGRIQDD